MSTSSPSSPLCVMICQLPRCPPIPMSIIRSTSIVREGKERVQKPISLILLPGICTLNSGDHSSITSSPSSASAPDPSHQLTNPSPDSAIVAYAYQPTPYSTSKRKEISKTYQDPKSSRLELIFRFDLRFPLLYLSPRLNDRWKVRFYILPIYRIDSESDRLASLEVQSTRRICPQ